jgi:hypothetical protein
MKNSAGILIREDSVAAWCCAHLLTKAGFQPALERTARPRLPAIMLSESALALIPDIFERPGLFRTAHGSAAGVILPSRGQTPAGHHGRRDDSA